jgi:Ca2+-binding EF-hand superfamily protein
MGKLVPITRAGKVEYNYYEGHFLKALSQAYRKILDAYDKQGNKISEIQNIALVIDEINRGNSSAIFGTIFQLLDRDEDGWSSYGINITEIEFMKILQLIGTSFSYDEAGKIESINYPPYVSEDVKKSCYFAKEDRIPEI